MKLVMIVNGIISDAFMELCSILRLITVVGMMVTEDVFITRKVIILREATSLFLFNSFNFSMAFIPNGVAAFPSPNIFITIFEDIYPMAGWSLGISGNIILTTFDSFLLTRDSSDEASAILVIPSQRHIRGSIVNIISIAVFPLVKRVFVRLGSLFIMLYVIPININNDHI